MFTLQAALIEALSFTDGDKSILRQLIANCQAPLEHRGPVRFTGDVIFDGDTIFNNHTNILGGSEVLWGQALAKWTDDGVNGHNSYVDCNRVDNRAGTGGSGTVRVYLPRTRPGDPNVRSGAIVGYVLDANGDAVAVTAYMDDKIGTIKHWIGSKSDIPAGWLLCDGTNGTVDMGGRVAFGWKEGGDEDNEFDTIGDTGGAKKHSHEEHVLYDHPADTVFTERGYVEMEMDIETIHLTGYTDNTDLQIRASNVYTEYERVYASSAGGTVDLDGYTDHAVSGVVVISDPEGAQPTQHANHVHETLIFNSCSGGQKEEADHFGGSYSRIFTGYQIKDDEDGAPCDANSPYPMEHYVVEPGQNINGSTIHNPFSNQGTGQEFEGIYGHRHAITGAISINSFSLYEPAPGHRHQITSLELETSLWIEDQTLGGGEPHFPGDPNYHRHFVSLSGPAEGHVTDYIGHEHSVDLPGLTHFGDLSHEDTRHINPYNTLAFIQRVD